MSAARTLTDADVDAVARRLLELQREEREAIADAVARKLRGDPAVAATPAPSIPRATRRPRRVASMEAHERVAAKNRRYSGRS